jgi:hypothetical protein
MAGEDTICEVLVRKQANALKEMLKLQMDSKMNQTATVVKGIVGDIKASKGEYTRHPAGLPVVYTGVPNNPLQSATVRDVFELASKNRPYICRVNRLPPTGGVVDCFSLNDTLGQVVRNDLRQNRTDMRGLVLEARERSGTSDRKQWTNWERAIFREIMDRQGRLKYVLGASMDSAGHKYPTGNLANMSTEHCHDLMTK